MTRMERLADFIGGGALTFYQDGWKRSAAFNIELRQIDDDNKLIMAGLAEKVIRRDEALRTIAAMKTPHANATVTRMAKVAEEALEK